MPSPPAAPSATQPATCAVPCPGQGKAPCLHQGPEGHRRPPTGNDGYQGSLITKCALRLAPPLFVRPGELRKVEWTEFNLDAAEWHMPAEHLPERRKMMQAWADYLDGLKVGAEVIPMRGRAA